MDISGNGDNVLSLSSDEIVDNNNFSSLRTVAYQCCVGGTVGYAAAVSHNNVTTDMQS